MESGTRLGPYEILEQLGAGGMGEVWLAEDTRLHRKVAIKVLPEEYAGDPERLARFEQEARASAALNHPHIAVVHDVGSETGDDASITHFMVQEYLEGETLREPLKKGALPLKKALGLATEIAEALAAAHSAGIIHRDLKPENIFVTKEGHAKVLDFGLAKLTEVAGSGSPDDFTHSPTAMGTVAGQVMGTAGYMAPEQVEGSPEIDHRADLFAFGCVLYEMVAGRRAFAGGNVHDTLNRILNDEPMPLQEAGAKLPHKLCWIVEKCLAKQPARRYQSAADLVVDLRGVATEIESGTGVTADSAPTRDGPRSLGRFLPWGLAAMGLALAVGSWMLRSQGEMARSLRFTIERGQLEGVDSVAPPFDVSRDGTAIVYVGAADTGGQLFYRPLGEFEATPLPGTQGARNPFFSPDGTHVGFFAVGELRKLDLAGGLPSTVASVQTVDGVGAWGDGEIFFSQEATRSGLFRVPDSGGDPTPLTSIDAAQGETGHTYPQLLPGDDRVLFHIQRGGAAGEIGVVSLSDGVVTTAGASSVPPIYVPSGHLLFLDSQSLLAAPFDIDALEMTGTRTAVVDHVINFRVAPSGTLVYAEGDDPRYTRALVKIDRQGGREELPLPNAYYLFPALSPDGTRLALNVGVPEAAAFIEIHDLLRGGRQQVARASIPQWASDDRLVFLFFSSEQTGQAQIVSRAMDSRADPKILVETEHTAVPTDVSVDGVVVYYVVHPETGRDLWTISLEDETMPQEFLVTEHSENAAVFSPDGEWLAYVSDASAQLEVYVRPFPAGTPEILISINGGREPRWSADGTEIFYRRGREMLAADVTTHPVFQRGETTVLFEGDFAVDSGGQIQMYDVDSDGSFYIVRVPPGGGRLSVITNWFEELKQRVPTGR